MFKTLLSIWPPYLFSGIKVDYVSSDYRLVVVSLRQTFYNRNHFGTHFGGSLFAMTDPFFMFMVLHNLDSQKYFVWDRSAKIDFLKPGKGVVQGKMTLTQEQLDDIKQRTTSGEKYEPTFQAEITDEEGAVVARYSKTIYVRLKPKFRQAS